MTVLARAGIDTSDPFGWSTAIESIPADQASSSRVCVGKFALSYQKTRDAQIDWLLKSMYDLLTDYFKRVEAIEGFVYMECVGIQLEKHFNRLRTEALSAFEKKTDISAAINVARRKRLSKLVTELQQKMDKIGPQVSHTLVKETKEMHLESKTLKTELHELAIRRLARARETSTERVVTLMSIWAKEEETSATSELKSLAEAIAQLEKAVGNELRESTFPQA